MDERQLRNQLSRIAGDVPSSTMPSNLVFRVRRRIAIVTSFGLILLVGFISTAVALIDRPRVDSDIKPAESLHSSRTTTDGSLRCDARLTSGSVAPGETLPLVISVTNLSERTRSVSPRGSGMRVLVASGDTVFDSVEYEAGIHGPYIPDEELEPGDTFEPLVRSRINIMWPGPLEIIPTCPLFEGPLPPLTLNVTVPGGAPSKEAALDAALPETHGLFKGCLPTSDGTWVTGVIEIPGAPDAPSMSARCSASIVQADGFDVVELRIVSPPEAPDHEMPQYIIRVPELPGTGSIETLRWTFVVTASQTREVEGLVNLHRTRPADRMAPYFDFYDGGWHEGGSGCGGTGSGGGILMISVCPP